VRRNLSPPDRPIAADFAQAQRAGRQNPLKQPRAACRTSPNSPTPSPASIDALPQPHLATSAPT
jgi:hypothetical protein